MAGDPLAGMVVPWWCPRETPVLDHRHDDRLHVDGALHGCIHQSNKANERLRPRSYSGLAADVRVIDDMSLMRRWFHLAPVPSPASALVDHQQQPAHDRQVLEQLDPL
jgi:hypothetical protein